MPPHHFGQAIYTLFFISNTRLKVAKNQAKAKQYPEAELLLFENYWLASSMLSSQNNRKYLVRELEGVNYDGSRAKF